MSRSKYMGVLVASLFVPMSTAAQGQAVDGVVLADGIAVEGAVVWVELDPEEIPRATALDTVVVDQRGLRFVPAVVAGRSGLTVEFLNSDPILHNVFSPDWSREPFDLGTYPSDTSRRHTFVETGPHLILCHVHPEMVAYVVVVETPFHAVTNPRGGFRFEGLPAGGHRLKIWRRGSEMAGRRVVVPGAGTLAVTLELNDLSE